MSANFKLEGNSAGAVKAVEALQKALDATGKEAEGAIVPTKKLQEAAQKLAQQADPQLRYNDQMRKLAEAVKGGGLELAKAETLAERYQRQLDGVSHAGDKAFGLGAATKLTAFVGGLAGVAQMFKNVEDAAQKSADAVFNSLAQAGELQQLGPEAFGKNAAVARQLIRSGAVSPENQGQAFDIATNLANAGFNDQDTQLLMKMAADRIVSPANLEPLGGSMRKLQNAFNGEAGDLSTVMDKVLVAAGATQANATQTVNEVLKFAGLAASAGVGDEQALAAFVGVEQRSPNAEAAAERLKSFFSQVNSKQLASGDLFGTLANVEGLVAKAGGNPFKILGDQNAVIGFKDLINSRDVVRSQLDAINNAGGALAERTGLLGMDPVLGPANASAIERGRFAITAQETDAARESLYDAISIANQRRDLERGGGFFNRILRSNFNVIADATADALGFEEQIFRGAQRVERQHPGTYAPETMQQLEAYFKRNNELMERQIQLMEDDSVKKRGGQAVRRGPAE